MATPEQSPQVGISNWQAGLKRSLDVALAIVGLIAVGWLILLVWIAASLETRGNGLFVQDRVGRHGLVFPFIKIRTMPRGNHSSTSVTLRRDPRITRLGRLLRPCRIDELPPLFNVLWGHMSFVGPRPDVCGFADELKGEDRIILSLRPGITGPATLQFLNEEDLLAEQSDPERYNRAVIYPEKIRLNRAYIDNYGFRNDLGYIWKTLVGVARSSLVRR